MRKIIALILSLWAMPGLCLSQTPPGSQKPQEVEAEDVIRITTNLVQTDVVVTDKNDHPIPDLKLEDFELFDNGKRQDLKFLEYKSIDTGERTEGSRPAAGLAAVADVPKNVSAKDLKRVVAFVVDDLTIPIEDVTTVKQLLLNFVNNDM